MFESLELDRKFQAKNIKLKDFLLFVDKFLPLLLRQLWYRIDSYWMSMVMVIVVNSVVMLVFMLEICCCLSIWRHSYHVSIQRVLVMYCLSHILLLYFMFNVGLIIYCLLRHSNTRILSVVVMIYTLGLDGARLRVLHFYVILVGVIVGGVVVMLVTH